MTEGFTPIDLSDIGGIYQPVPDRGFGWVGSRKRYADNPRERGLYMREWKRQNLYALTADAYDELVEEAAGHCMSCGREAKLEIDHDHNNGRVRGLLCGLCNKAAGMLHDDPIIILKLFRYIVRRNV